MTYGEDDALLDIDDIPSARDATLAWDDHMLVVRAIDPARAVRDEGYQTRVGDEKDDRLIPLSAITCLRATRPWPAIEVEWQWPESAAVYRLVVHPRGIRHPIPRAREVLASYERFGELVEQLFAHLPKRTNGPAELALVRGWLDERVVPFQPVPALPTGNKGPDGPYRGSGEGESLIVRTDLPAALLPRIRQGVSQLLSRGSTHDALTAIGLSERFIWVVKASGPILRIAREHLRGLFTRRERVDLVFGRSTFLSVKLPTDSLIRAALIDAAHEAAAHFHAGARIA